MMASDDKKVKTNPAQKNEASPKSKGTSGVDLSKAEGGEIAADLPSGYSRGEGQKPVSKAYRDNWNVIFAKKKKRICTFVIRRDILLDTSSRHEGTYSHEAPEMLAIGRGPGALGDGREPGERHVIDKPSIMQVFAPQAGLHP